MKVVRRDGSNYFVEQHSVENFSQLKNGIKITQIRQELIQSYGEK